MTVKHFEITSATTAALDVMPKTPICAILGNYSDLALDLLREIIGDLYIKSSPDRYDDGRFVIHAEMDLNNKNYNICYIRNADFIGDNRIAVNFNPLSIEFSTDDTMEYLEEIQTRNLDFDNVFYRSEKKDNRDLPESQRILRDFEEWMEKFVYCSTDTRPLFIYDAFELFDMSLDISKMFDMLSTLGRQTFISVGKNYPKEKLLHNSVTVVSADGEERL